MAFNIYYPADPVTLEDASALVELQVKLRDFELKFEARAKYICNLIADAYSFNVKHTKLYDSSYLLIKLPSNPVTVGVELSPKNKKLPMTEKKGIVMPDDEIHFWKVREPKIQVVDRNYQDFNLPGHWFYGGDLENELKEGIAKWNMLSPEKRKE